MTARLTLLLLLLIVLLVAACGGGDESGNTPTPVAQVETRAPTRTPTVTPTPPPTWTPPPTSTPRPAQPTLAITLAPTRTPNLFPTATPRPSLAPITAANAAQLAEIERLERGITHDFAWSPDGMTVALAMADGVRVFVGADFALTPRLLRFDNYFYHEALSVSFSPDGTRIAAGSDWGELAAWEFLVYRRLYTHDLTWFNVADVTHSPGGSLLAVASDRILLYDSTTGNLLRVLETSFGSPLSLAFRPTDGAILVMGGDYSVVQVWDPAEGVALAEVEGDWSETRPVAYHPGGVTFVSGSDVGSVLVWTIDAARAGEPVFALEGRGGAITRLAYSLDGSLLAVGASNGTLQLWDLDTQQVVFRTQAHASEVSALAWSPDGTRLYSAGLDSIVRVWGIVTGSEAG
jgi:WD40 repeat protein